jgi:hypothetical protein
MGAGRVRRLRLQDIPKRYRCVQLWALASRCAFVEVNVILSVIGFPTSTLRLEFGVESPDSQVFLQRHTIASFTGEGIVGRRYLQEVGVLLAQQILEEGINVHGAHPSLLIVSKSEEDVVMTNL